jgi:hypothetical protein
MLQEDLRQNMRVQWMCDRDAENGER